LRKKNVGLQDNRGSATTSCLTAWCTLGILIVVGLYWDFIEVNMDRVVLETIFWVAGTLLMNFSIQRIILITVVGVEYYFMGLLR